MAADQQALGVDAIRGATSAVNWGSAPAITDISLMNWVWGIE